MVLVLAGVDGGIGEAPSDTLLVEERSFGSFEGAVRISGDIRGRFLVVDRGASTLTVFSPDLQVAGTAGGFGWGSAGLDRPSGVTTDGISTYVADHGNHRVVRLDQSFTPVSYLSTRDTSYAPARFGYPLGVGLSRQGDLFVLDGENLRVLKFDRRSVFERSFGGMEAGAGRLSDPVELLVTVHDRVWVLEKTRIVEFDFTGNVVRLLADGRFANARGFCATGSGAAIATGDRLLFIGRDGSMEGAIETGSILAGVPIDAVDLFVSGDRLFILTPKTVVEFSVKPAR